jgi:hypothetical protein
MRTPEGVHNAGYAQAFGYMVLKSVTVQFIPGIVGR